MHIGKAVASQVAKKTVATTSTIRGRAAPACQVGSDLREALGHGGSRWLSTSDGTDRAPAGLEERPSGSGGEELLRNLSAEEVEHARSTDRRTAMSFTYLFVDFDSPDLRSEDPTYDLPFLLAALRCLLPTAVDGHEDSIYIRSLTLERSSQRDEMR